MGGVRVGFSANGKIDRREFGLTWNQALEAGGVVVGNDVKISLEAQAVKVVKRKVILLSNKWVRSCAPIFAFRV